MWLSLEPGPESNSFRIRGKTVQGLALAMAGVVFCVQVYWTFSASLADWRGSYSGGKSVAGYIKSNHLEGKTIYATTFWSTDVQPYFAQNIFRNRNHGKEAGFYLWSSNNGNIEDFSRILEDRPDVIVVGRPNEAIGSVPGYTCVGWYEGNVYWKTEVKERNPLAVLVRNDMGAPARMCLPTK
jgi:hypothetical protein